MDVKEKFLELLGAAQGDAGVSNETLQRKFPGESYAALLPVINELLAENRLELLKEEGKQDLTYRLRVDVPDRLRDDADFVLTAVAQNGRALCYASDRLRDDESIVRAAVAPNGYALLHASARLRDDERIVRTAVAKYGYALEYASDRLRDDEGIVRAAVAQNGRALRWASDRLHDDADFVRAIVAQRGDALRFASDRLRDDESIVRAAVAQDARALEHASARIKIGRRTVVRIRLFVLGHESQYPRRQLLRDLVPRIASFLTPNTY